MSAVLAALAVLLAAAGLWELAGSRGEEITAAGRRALGAATGGRARSLAEAALRLGIPQRLERAGLAERLGVPAVLGGKLAGAGLGALAATSLAPAAPGRLAVAVAVGLPAAGFLGPDALLEREARLRRRRLAAALPDALDLLAVGAAAGRSPGAVIGEIARGTTGPLARELAVAVAEIECGCSQAEALEALRRRVPGAEVGALAAALERSRRYGSPLAEQLREQATSLRRDQRRRIEEEAARAAPKIQLVVALVLVPSVLLMLTAALVANSDVLLGGSEAGYSTDSSTIRRLTLAAAPHSPSSSTALSSWPLTLTQRMPATSSKASPSGASSLSQTMKLGEKSWRSQFGSVPLSAKISWLRSSSTLSSSSRRLVRKTSSVESRNRRPERRWQ